jgi:uracil-DNA glycosylase family 4
MHDSLLHDSIAACRLCPRLVRYREGVKQAKRFADWHYWHRPVPGFGDANARLLIVGLAPSAHGGNRTGRIFTGDASGNFLFRAIHDAGMSNKPESVSADDGLELKGVYVTAVVKCAPPGDRPERIEAQRCVTSFFGRELEMLKKVRVIVPLGAFAFKWLGSALGQMGIDASGMRVFEHNRLYDAGRYTVLASYHVSPRNTNTGTLTYQGFVRLLRKGKKLAQG